jgi:4-amino-4-deoxy-L-arabinose transferase-like glycosyltransferase
MIEKKEIAFLLIILTIASFFRLWQLDSIPPGLYPDVAINGNDALDSLKTGHFKVFYPENNGREGLMMWLIALSFSIFGVSIWSIKIVAAIIGILTVFGLYLLAKELFNNSKIVALLSSFFLAISFWHVNFSRIGFRAILVPFILVFGFYFLFKFLTQLKNQSQYPDITLYRSVILSGVLFGLGFYTYISYRFIVILLPLILVFWWFIYRKENLQKKFLFLVICHLSLVILVALPIGIYFLQHPQDFIGRAAPVSIFAAENPIKELGKSLILHLGMFNFYGDPNWRHNFSGSPMLLWPIGILFLIGFALSIKELINFRKHKNLSLVISHLSLVIWFFIMLLPGILTYEGVPHVLRTIGVIPVAYIFVGLGAWKVYEFLNRNTTKKILLFIAAILFLLSMGISEFNKYFMKWAKNPEVENAFSKNYVEIGNYLNSLPKDVQKYVIVNMPGVPVPYPNGIPMPAQTVMFIENTKYGFPQSIYLLPEDLDKIKIEKRPTKILLMGYDENLLNNLRQKFPGGKIIKEDPIFGYEIE